MFLRIYANCVDDEAAGLSAALESALIHYEPRLAAMPKQYWKMPELFEFTYRLSSPHRDIWDELVAQRPSGWHVVDDSEERSAVWNRAADQVFLAPAVRWAELAGLA
jgi:hypothetical protein